MQTSYLTSLSLTLLNLKKKKKLGRVVGGGRITCQYCAKLPEGGEREKIPLYSATTHNRDHVTPSYLTQITLEHS